MTAVARAGGRCLPGGRRLVFLQVQGKPGCVARGLSLLLVGLPGEKARCEWNALSSKEPVPQAREKLCNDLSTIYFSWHLTTFLAHKRKRRATGGGGTTVPSGEGIRWTQTSEQPCCVNTHRPADELLSCQPEPRPVSSGLRVHREHPGGCSALNHLELYDAPYPPGDTQELRLM